MHRHPLCCFCDSCCVPRAVPGHHGMLLPRPPSLGRRIGTRLPAMLSTCIAITRPAVLVWQRYGAIGVQGGGRDGGGGMASRHHRHARALACCCRYCSDTAGGGGFDVGPSVGACPWACHARQPRGPAAAHRQLLRAATGVLPSGKSLRRTSERPGHVRCAPLAACSAALPCPPRTHDASPCRWLRCTSSLHSLAIERVGG